MTGSDLENLVKATNSGIIRAYINDEKAAVARRSAPPPVAAPAAARPIPQITTQDVLNVLPDIARTVNENQNAHGSLGFFN